MAADDDQLAEYRDKRNARRSGPWNRLVQQINTTPLPATLHDLGTGAIVALSPPAAELLGGEADEFVGRSIEEFLDGASSGGMQLLAEGKLGAYETRRQARRTGIPVCVWVRRLPVAGLQAAVGVLVAEEADPAPPALPRGHVVAIGSVDDQLTIKHLTSDIAGILGLRAEDLVGTSLLRLVDPGDAGRLIELTACTADAGFGGARTLRLRQRPGGHARCEVLLVPHVPDGGYAFTIMAVGEAPGTAERALQSSLRLLPAEAHSAGVAQDAAHLRTRKLLGQLGSRELEVVTELLNGHRVPAIARALYLSQGTVRNHLSTAYRKLGVHNQQELIDLLRRPGVTSRTSP